MCLGFAFATRALRFLSKVPLCLTADDFKMLLALVPSTRNKSSISLKNFASMAVFSTAVIFLPVRARKLFSMAGNILSVSLVKFLPSSMALNPTAEISLSASFPNSKVYLDPVPSGLSPRTPYFCNILTRGLSL